MHRAQLCAIVVAVSMLFVGCQGFRGAQRDEARLAMMHEKERGILAECELKRLNGELKTYAESTRCSNPVIIQAHQAAGDPAMDLVYLLAAYRLAVAERIDAGTLSRAEGNLMVAQLVSRMNTDRLQRDMADEPRTTQSYAALLQGLGTWLSSGEPPVQGRITPHPGPSQPSYKSPIACYEDGPLITCR